jgi:predicted N-acetyltransferase YhbS
VTHVRRYRDEDRAAATAVQREAFGRGLEAGVFERLVDEGDALPHLSFVAVEADRVVGHVVCSRATVGDRSVAAVGPIGVLSAYQRAGIGSALMQTTLGAADALDVPVVVLLGSTDYYARFGFVPASWVGIESPNDTWGDHLQARVLSGYTPDVVGPFRFAPAFDDT